MIVKAATVITNCFLTVFAVGVVLSVSWMLKENVPMAFGVPPIVPVAGASDKPPGNGEDPAASDHVYGVAPPVPVSA